MVAYATDAYMRPLPWWRHQMETFSALLAICAGNSPVTGEFPTQRPVTRTFDVFFDLHLDKQLSKQWEGWWFETPLHPLWRHCNASLMFCYELRIRTGINYHHNSITPLSSELFLDHSLKIKQLNVIILTLSSVTTSVTTKWNNLYQDKFQVSITLRFASNDDSTVLPFQNVIS